MDQTGCVRVIERVEDRDDDRERALRRQRPERFSSSPSDMPSTNGIA